MNIAPIFGCLSSRTTRLVVGHAVLPLQKGESRRTWTAVSTIRVTPRQVGPNPPPRIAAERNFIGADVELAVPDHAAGVEIGAAHRDEGVVDEHQLAVQMLLLCGIE